MFRFRLSGEKEFCKGLKDENLLYVDEDGQRHYHPYRTTVYNIEVEDYHTYCVDTGGILVHNQNCGAAGWTAR